MCQNLELVSPRSNALQARASPAQDDGPYRTAPGRHHETHTIVPVSFPRVVDYRDVLAKPTVAMLIVSQLHQLATTLAVPNISPVMARRRCQVIAIGFSPRCST